MDYNELPLTGNLTVVETGYGIDTPEISLPRFASIEDMVKILRPNQPVHCMNPESLTASARLFLDNFNGHSLYAVKANPDPYVLQRLYAAGVRHFDVASLGEVALVRGLFPDAHLAFMHPVKSREAIRASYFDYGVRDFAIDTFEEMHKILEETKVAADLTLIVRLAMPKGSAAYELTGKFGCSPEVAVSLLQDADKVAHRVGISFHVGSQTLDPQSYADAIRKAGEVIKQSKVQMDVFDVGGGFPTSYVGNELPPLTAFFDVIKAEIAKLKLPKACKIWAEPGRALVNASETVVVRVELRKGDALYINDGSYGSLFDAAHINWVYPVQLIRPSRKGRKAASKALAPFSFYGPTCDSIDHMKGPFMLAEDVCEGDWIAISNIGAYGRAMKTKFNGFGATEMQVEIDSAMPAARRAARKSFAVTSNGKLTDAAEEYQEA